MYNFAAYTEQAAATAVYPRQKRDVELAYLALGLVEEAAEFAWAKRSAAHGQKELLAELGDVCWYLAMLTRALRLDVQHELDPALVDDTLPEIAAAIAGTVKRVYRDAHGTPNDVQRSYLRATLREALARVEHEAHLQGWTLHGVWQHNLAKLADRRRRGQLQGMGDYR